MKVSKVIEALKQIQDKFGDIEVTGGNMVPNVSLSQVLVLDVLGREIWPTNPNGLDLTKVTIEGVHLE